MIDGISTMSSCVRSKPAQYHFYVHDTSGFVQTKKAGTAVNIVGTVTAKINIDFGARTVGGGNSYVAIDNMGGSGTVNITDSFFDPISFENLGGQATFSGTDPTGKLTSSITFSNDDGIIAGEADMTAVYNDTVANDYGTANIQDIDRSDGLAP